MTKRGAIAQRVRTTILPLLMSWLLRLPRMRRLAFRTISQIGISYRDSPLSEGGAGSVQGGDRLPWVETRRQEDNFAPLASLAWQVHVYGEARPGWRTRAPDWDCRSTRSSGRSRWEASV